MKFFDINCMLGPTNTNREPAFLNVQSLLAEMDRVGIEEALVFSSLARESHPIDGNQHIVEAVQGIHRLHPCWVVLPPGTLEMPEPGKLVERMKSAGVRAARMCPVQHRYPLIERSCRALFKELTAAKIPLLIDTNRPSWSQTTLDWRDIFDVAENHPDLQLVLLREGGTTARVLFSVWDDFPNIKLDASYLQESRIVEEIVERFGAERLLFGTAMPQYDAGGPLASVLGAPVSDAARDSIAGDNARRLLGLPVLPSTTRSVWPCGERGFRVFDVHGHLGPWEAKYYPDSTAEQMITRMDQLGIERFVFSDMLGIGPDFRRGNDRVAKAITQFPDRLMGYVVYNPNYEASMKEEMRRCFDDLGFHGIKLHCATHDTSTEDPSYRLAFETAHERACPVLCHCNEGPSPEFLTNLLNEFSDMKFIFAHLGGCTRQAISKFVDVANECPNLFLELSVSVMPRGVLAWLVEQIPVDQILYGSDHPINEFSFQLGRVLFADIDDNLKQRILWDNAARIFKLKPDGSTRSSDFAINSQNNVNGHGVEVTPDLSLSGKYVVAIS